MAAAIAASRSCFPAGVFASCKIFNRIRRRAPFHISGIRFFSVVNNDNGPLTLTSLGLNRETEITFGNEKNKLQQGVSTVEFPKKKVKILRNVASSGIVGVKSSFDIETAPFAAKSFSELGIPDSLVNRLEEEGFKVPTDVQATAIPAILKKNDVVIQSYTGSGKTLAYLLPILSKIKPVKDESSKGNNVQAVIVAPSRELGMQIVREVEKLLGAVDKKLVQQLVGGANKSRQEEALKKNKPAIVVGTPGRIAEISASGKLHTHNCRYLVLDEVDELLAFNFREDIHRIIEHVGRSGAGDHDHEWRQTIMVSATVPFSVVRAARRWAHDPLLAQARTITSLESVSVSVSVTPSGPASVSKTSENSDSIQSLPPRLEHYYSVTRIQHKVDALRRCVHALDAKSVIAFMNHTKQLKDAVFKLEARGMEAAELHGDLNKLTRSTILKKFKKGEVRVLVTNELSARGLDIPECDLVVNLELPTDSVHYAHRAGRTGRLGRKGTVVSICEEAQVFVMKKMQKQLGIVIKACEFTEGKLTITEEEEKSQLAVGKLNVL